MCRISRQENQKKIEPEILVSTILWTFTKLTLASTGKKSSLKYGEEHGKKLDVTSSIISDYAVLIRIESLIKYSEQIKLPKFWENYISIFLFIDILIVTEKKPLQNHMTRFFNYMSRLLQ